MKIDTICIRNARKADMENIFWILHSGSIPWRTDEIIANMENLYVLTYRDELICVVYCDLNITGQKIHWTAVHPMYPENTLSSAICSSLLGLVNH